MEKKISDLNAWNVDQAFIDAANLPIKRTKGDEDDLPPEDSDEDWNKSFDDMDSEDWENYFSKAEPDSEDDSYRNDPEKDIYLDDREW